MAAAYRARMPKSADTSANGRRDYSFKWPKDAGVAGILSTYYSGYPGTDKVFGNPRQQVPTVDVTCEDWNLLYRLALNHQGPRVRLNAEAKSLGEKPVFNVVASIKGSEKPDEYIVLSAHYDSWDAGSGATDNGTGTIAMMEALRIIRAVYPKPRRTIIVGHWGGEEQGLLGSKAWVDAHLAGEANRAARDKLDVYFNIDNGTGKIYGFYLQENKAVQPLFDAWLAPLKDLGARKNTMEPIGSTDHLSFIDAGVPGFNPIQDYVDYDVRTHHTNMDTNERLQESDIQQAAIVMATFAYQCAMADQRIPRPAKN
jgi:Zn-dependent M28 family amino/carboxypeptidase